jgi:hypothetical protein
MSIRRIIHTGLISTALVLASGSAAHADRVWDGAGNHSWGSLLDLLLILKLKLLSGGGLGLF